MIDFRFGMTEGDHCIYTKVSGRKVVLLSFYVDDILIAGNDVTILSETKV